MAFYYKSIRPTSRQSSSNNIETDYAAFVYYCLNEWATLMGFEMAQSFDSIAGNSAPYIGVILKGPNAGVDTANPMAYMYRFSTSTANTYSFYDYVKDTSMVGDYRTSETMNYNGRSDNNYFNGYDTTEAWWSDTPGCRYFIFKDIATNVNGLFEIPVMAPELNSYPDSNSRWVEINLKEVTARIWGVTNKASYEIRDYSRKWDFYGGNPFLEQYDSVEYFRCGRNLPIRNAGKMFIGHMADNLLLSGFSNDHALVKVDNKYYYSVDRNQKMFFRIA